MQRPLRFCVLFLRRFARVCLAAKPALGPMSLPRSWTPPKEVRSPRTALGRSAWKLFALRQQCGGRCGQHCSAHVNFQVTVLKILRSYPDGFASMPDLKRDMAILATSGPDWAARAKRMGARVPELDLFSQRLVERVNGGWRITDKGRAMLELMESRPRTPQVQPEDTRASFASAGAIPF